MTQLKGGLLLKILKYFTVMLKIFEFFHVKEIVESLLVYVIKFSELSIYPIIQFLDRRKKTKLVPAFFS